MVEKATSTVTLPIDLGTPLQIEIVGFADRYKSFLIGMERGEFLIVKSPMGEELEEYDLVKLEYRIRYVFDGTVYGFEAGGLRTVPDPLNVLFIDFPQQVENYELRSSRRISCTLPSSVKVEDQLIPGVFLDLSEKGGCFATKTEDAALFETERPVAFSCLLPGSGEKVELGATIRRTETSGDRVSVGVEFEKSDPDLVEFINSIVELVAGGRGS